MRVKSEFGECITRHTRPEATAHYSNSVRKTPFLGFVFGRHRRQKRVLHRELLAHNDDDVTEVK